MIDGSEETTKIAITEEIDNHARKQADEILLKAGALQRAILNSANFSSIATDKGVIQIFNVGAERMLRCRRQNYSGRYFRSAGSDYASPRVKH
jgi:PAS domain-containing protein